MNYVPALDGVRAIAVLTVIVFHTFYDRFPGGYIGVDLFFVLSGYLITSNLLAEWENCGRIDMPGFWLRRVRRLAPGLYVFLACLAFAALFTKIRNDVLEAIGFAATYTMNWARAFELGPDTVLAHTWSLAIEQQFYLIWPIVLSALLAKTGRRGAPLATLALILAVLGWRIALEAMHAPGTRIYNGFDTRSDALLVGCLLAFLPGVPQVWSPWLFWAASLVGYLFVLFGNNGEWSLIWGFTAFAAVAAVWIAAAASAVAGQFAHTVLTLEPLVAIGRISYGMYLWHYPILLVLKSLDLPSGVTINLELLLTISVAAASFHWIERPFLTKGSRSIVRYGQALEPVASKVS
ncbi:acyltransferase family protein [Phyllobacterium chamaecytisi]|uniref:acyltransferase family protein n=1 Tax=Phyllobacterium chamaecytisi TaxID=2876082 RepID=UPI001CCD9AB9|nr:acyltransferase [Phyllobacterium sp. KW56]MBZ9604234.1 acyltransferase [Phyllobacterium sp. KW56]